MARHAGMVVTGSGAAPLDHVVQQLWQGPVDSGHVRVVIDPVPDPSWRTVESYWVLPGISSARLLVPTGSRKLTAASLRHYRRLRPWTTRLVRNVLAAAFAAGLTPGRSALHVQVQDTDDGVTAAAQLPLATISAHLRDAAGQPGNSTALYCSMGIRTGDNRKPTLQLIDADGRPAGYAKLAWNSSSSEFIRTESAALAELAPLQGAMKVPELVCSGAQGGFPFLVTAPLPAGVRAVRGSVAAPNAAELYSLCPIERVGRVGSTRHFQSLMGRLSRLTEGSDGALAASTSSLAATIQARDAALPVAARWHGDMVPWNTARDAAGQLWCWDWETAEADAVAGLDAVHWMFSVLRENRSGPVAENLRAAVHDAQQHLHAAGIRAENFPDLAGVYALVVAERAWTLATDLGSWESAWITEAELLAFVDSARAWLAESTVSGS